MRRRWLSWEITITLNSPSSQPEQRWPGYRYRFSSLPSWVSAFKVNAKEMCFSDQSIAVHRKPIRHQSCPIRIEEKLPLLLKCFTMLATFDDRKGWNVSLTVWTRSDTRHLGTEWNKKWILSPDQRREWSDGQIVFLTAVRNVDVSEVFPSTCPGEACQGCHGHQTYDGVIASLSSSDCFSF